MSELIGARKFDLSFAVTSYLTSILYFSFYLTSILFFRVLSNDIQLARAYCWKDKKLRVLYNPTMHAHNTEQAKKTLWQDKKGNKHVTVRWQECRMHFGHKLLFDHSHNHNLTGGQARVIGPQLRKDDNGQPKFYAPRNHPRIVQAPHGSAYFGANCDTQVILIARDVIDKIGRVNYEKFCKNIVAAGWGGLDHNNSLYIVTKYITGYQCKGAKTTTDHKEVVDVSIPQNKPYHAFLWLGFGSGFGSSHIAHSTQAITSAYITDQDNSSKTIRGLMHKHMHELVNGISVPTDMTAYILAGAPMKRGDRRETKKCSLTSVYLDTLAPDCKESDKAFTWNKIKKRYAAWRKIEEAKPPDQREEHLSVYQYVCLHWARHGKTVPQFLGWHDYPRWPIQEEYAKNNLFLHKPWSKKPEEVKEHHETYSVALWEYCQQDNCRFPLSKYGEILRAKRGDKAVDDSEGTTVTGNLAYTPTSERNNKRNDIARELHMIYICQLNHLVPFNYGLTTSLCFTELANCDPSNTYNRQNEEDLPEETFNQLNMRHDPTKDWSENFDEETLHVLKNTTQKFYADLEAKINRGEEETMELLDYAIFNPEAQMTDAQQFIVNHHLYHLREWHLYYSEQTDTPPPSQLILVEGLPGVGKSFMIKVIRNITRLYYNRNNAELVSAPTGAAASIIAGKTHHRNLAIPTGKAFNDLPKNVTITNASRILAMTRSLRNCNCVLKDEHSMDGTQMWAHVRQRHEELRQHHEIDDTDVVEESDENQNMDDSGSHEHVITPLPVVPPCIAERPFGGYPFFYSWGDFNQLPPVCQTSCVKYNQPVSGSPCDALGRLAFSDFINPPPDAQVESTIVFMEDVKRTSDAVHLDFCDRVRKGNMRIEEARHIKEHCLDKLPADTKQQFDKDGIHLVPFWKMAHPIVANYLSNQLTAPIAKLRAHTHTDKQSKRICHLNDTSLPLLNALCVGAIVILLKNMMVELNLMNGAVGYVRDICYRHKDGPNQPMGNKHPDMYVVVEFPLCTNTTPMIPNKPATWIPIYPVEERCEKCKRCTITAIPLRVCKALSVQKSQGMTVGEGEMFKKVIMYLLEQQERQTPGIELTAASRVKKGTDLAFGNDSSKITLEMVQNIGRSQASQDRRQFINTLKEMAGDSKSRTMHRIADLDPSSNKTYEGGARYLMDWFKRTVADRLPNNTQQH